MKVAREIGHRNVWTFFIMTFAFSWLLWMPFVLAGFGIIQLSESLASLMTPAVMLGAFGPLFAAVILVVRKDKWTGVKILFS